MEDARIEHYPGSPERVPRFSAWRLMPWCSFALLVCVVLSLPVYNMVEPLVKVLTGRGEPPTAYVNEAVKYFFDVLCSVGRAWTDSGISFPGSLSCA